MVILTDTRPKILCLGVSYADIHAELKLKGYKDDSSLVDVNNIERNAAVPTISSRRNSNNPSSHTVLTAETAIRCVEERVLNQMDGRDLARILATEETCHVDIYCVSQEKGAIYRSDRHLDTNFNRPSFVKKLQTAFSPSSDDCVDNEKIHFDQIILDYYWIPTGWDVHHWSMNFFETTLISFVKSRLICAPPQLPATATALNSVCHQRGIYLPFCFHCFQAIVAFSATLSKHYNISFLRKNELQCITLWAGTQSIDKQKMQHTLGKRIDQEEIYCTFNARHIKEMECSGIGASKKELINVASCIEDFPDVRFIVLEPLQVSDPADPQYIYGRFIGLVSPESVQRGFRSDEKLLSPSLTRLIRTSDSFPSPPPSVVVGTRKRKVQAKSPSIDRVNCLRKSPRIIERNRSPNSVLAISLQSPTATTTTGKRTLQPKALFSSRLNGNTI